MKRRQRHKARLDIRFDIAATLEGIRADVERWYGEYRVRLGSMRLQTFTKGLSCVDCGIEGSVFYLDIDNGGAAHLNLYAVVDGKEVMMTSDHIIPKSKGGSDRDLRNRQPMCEPCNRRKGCEMRPGEIGVAKRIDIVQA